jgi:hypothetical protein
LLHNQQERFIQLWCHKLQSALAFGTSHIVTATGMMIDEPRLTVGSPAVFPESMI